MSNNKQSSIEHYEEEINKLINQFLKGSISKTDFIIQNHNLFYTIQAMHKQEIIDTFFEGAYGGDNISGEQYYNEHYEK